MLYETFLRSNGGRLSGSLEQRLCLILGTNPRGLMSMELLTLAEHDAHVQRSITGQLLLHPDWFTESVTAELKAFASELYNRYVNDPTSKPTHYGFICDHGSFYNPDYKASQIYGRSTAELWNVE